MKINSLPTAVVLTVVAFSVSSVAGKAVDQAVLTPRAGPDVPAVPSMITADAITNSARMADLEEQFPTLFGHAKNVIYKTCRIGSSSWSCPDDKECDYGIPPGCK